MSVRERSWTENGRLVKAWVVDVQMDLPGRGTVRVRKTSPVNGKRQAEQFEHRLRASMLDGSYWRENEPPAKKVTLGEFLPRYLTHAENGNKFSTVETKRALIANHLEPFFGAMPLEDIGPGEIEAFKAEMRKKVSGAPHMKDAPTKQALQRRSGKPPKLISPKTVNNALTVLSNILTVAEEQRVIDQARRVRRLKVGKPAFDFLQFDEAERLIAAVEPEWRPAVLLAVKAGLRLGEIRGLQWSDVDLVRGVVVIRRNFWKEHLNDTPKGGRSRTVDMPPSLVESLKAARHLRGKWVFADEQGNPPSQKQLDRPLNKAVRAAGIAREEGRVGWHDLRHTYGSHLAMRGVPMRTIQELMGHASIEQTMRYAHLSPEVKRDAVKVLDTPATWAGMSTPEVAAHGRHMALLTKESQ